MKLQIAALFAAWGLRGALGTPIDDANVGVSEGKDVSSFETYSHLSKRYFGGDPSTGEICPQTQGLFYKTSSGATFQIGCSVDTAGGTLLAVYKDQSNVLACTQQCDSWNKSPSGKGRLCGSATYYKTPPNGVHNCYIRQTDVSWLATAPIANAESGE
ncbi:hypothetical protein INS49_004686 [Diaporthe citri]|uniref:uncharacterized protein n=1 Tax=Diaporthe citri TaxID=83186 RepID=UPI001C800CA4|nr:uncharacterized protein INS49_004686 [Diaporthe citri]KAG6354668.1 hypothetical protein INS49_004686 [Diaporthe citri]